MGLPEATIVASVETWATATNQGISEDEIARRIADFRGVPHTGGGVLATIRTLIQTEHGNAWHLPDTNIEWCIREARGAYGI